MRALACSIRRALRQVPPSAIPMYRANLSHSPGKNGIARPYRQLSSYRASDVSMQEYHKISDATMEALLDSLEELIDRHPQLPYEVDYHSGVLTLQLGDKGTYVINKQPPNKQIWLSSPKSGPKRYDLDLKQNEWFYNRDGVTLRCLLEEELSTVFGETVRLRLDDE